jgi:acyl-CoA synthetase (AMP-forming)/AMP-acid ligase II
VYFSGDGTSIDEDGYVWFSGRADEIIKIAGHRIGTVEVETAFLCHAAVAEASVTAVPTQYAWKSSLLSWSSSKDSSPLSRSRWSYWISSWLTASWSHRA